jgi:hypothetical protein
MGPCPPETALCDIVNFALEGDVNRLSVFSIKRQEFFRGHLSHLLFLASSLAELYLFHLKGSRGSAF